MITTIIFLGKSNGADELCSQTCISSFKVINFADNLLTLCATHGLSIQYLCTTEPNLHAGSLNSKRLQIPNKRSKLRVQYLIGNELKMRKYKKMNRRNGHNKCPKGLRHLLKKIKSSSFAKETTFYKILKKLNSSFFTIFQHNISIFVPLTNALRALFSVFLEEIIFLF